MRLLRSYLFAPGNNETLLSKVFKAGADAVDLESAAVARVAERMGLPFAVLRAVCDTADRAPFHLP